MTDTTTNPVISVYDAPVGAPPNRPPNHPQPPQQPQRGRRSAIVAASLATVVGLVGVGVVALDLTSEPGTSTAAEAQAVGGLPTESGAAPSGGTGATGADAGDGTGAGTGDGAGGRDVDVDVDGSGTTPGDGSASGRSGAGQPGDGSDGDGSGGDGGVDEPAEVVVAAGGTAFELTDLAGPIADAAADGTDVVDTNVVDEGSTAIAGTATFELPLGGALSDAVIDMPLRGKVGIATGADLEHLGAHLRADQMYMYVDLGRQEFDLDLNIDAGGLEQLPERISTAGSPGASMFVAALDGDYFYLSVPCGALSSGAKKSQPKRRDNPNADRSADEIPGVSLDLSDFDPGGCGVGWSVGGFIPFTPLDARVGGDDDFAGHVVIDGTMPVAAMASVDGEMFIRVEQDSVQMRINGELDLSVPFFKGALDIAIPVGQGTFAIDASVGRMVLSIAATVGTIGDNEPMRLLMSVFPSSGQVSLTGLLEDVGGELQPNSFLELAGDLRLGVSPLSEISGADVNDTATVNARVRVDSSGVFAEGDATTSPLGGLVVGEARLEAFIAFPDLADSYLDLQGRLEVGGVGLGADAALRIDRAGAFANGRVGIDGFGELAVEGWLGADGFQLTGSAGVTLPIGDLDKVAANLIDTSNNAEVIRALNAQIDQRVNEIAAGDAGKGQELRNTIGDMRAAFSDLAAINDTIAYNNGLIAQLWRDHQADIDWHWALNDFDRFWDKGPHAARLGVILAEIGVLESANAVQAGYRDVATLVVSGTQQLAIGIVGWDAELNALLALQTEAYLNTLVGNFVATVVNGADAVLDAFGVDGSAVGTVTFTVGTEGLGATATLEWCRDGDCSTLAGATVAIGPGVEVCATIVGVPSCVRL